MRTQSRRPPSLVLVPPEAGRIQRILGLAVRMTELALRRAPAVARVAMALACFAWVGSCESPVEPILRMNVALQSLGVSEIAALRDSGLLVVVGAPQDTNIVLPPSGRLQLDVLTSAADAESFDLSPILCDDFYLACHEIGIVMKDGAHLRDLFSLLNAVPARVSSTAFNGELGAAFVFAPERAPTAVEEIRKHPLVKTAERSQVAAFPPPRRWGLRGGLPLDFRPVSAHDGALQGQPGDTIRVRYTQPDSSILEFTFAIPVP